MNYYEIGQRVRGVRKSRNLSQEELAERVDISVTHMSHIETGNTKLSLPVLVQLAEVLNVRTDDLLFDSITAEQNMAMEDISGILSHCTPGQAKVLADLVKTAKQSMDKHL